MVFFGRSKSSVGLDVGSGFVKVVEVDHGGGQPCPDPQCWLLEEGSARRD